MNYKKIIIPYTNNYNFNTILDIGAGNGNQSLWFYKNKKKVYSFTNKGRENLINIADKNLIILFKNKILKLIIGDMHSLPFKNDSFDAVWASNVLEHSINPILALKEWNRVLKKNGYLFIIVPPFKSYIVGEHLFTGWNCGQLMLLLLICGYNIKDGRYAQIGKNIIAFVEKSETIIDYKNNDEMLIQHCNKFPKPIAEMIQKNKSIKRKKWIGSYNGNIKYLNWFDKQDQI